MTHLPALTCYLKKIYVCVGKSFILTGAAQQSYPNGATEQMRLLRCACKDKRYCGPPARTGVMVTGPIKPDSMGAHLAAVKRPSSPRFSLRRAAMFTL